jgi:hypothetical protein
VFTVRKGPSCRSLGRRGSCPAQHRLVTKINFPYRVVYIRFVGTHEDYDGVDAETV